MTSKQNAITGSGLILTVTVYGVGSVLKALHELIELSIESLKPKRSVLLSSFYR